MLTHRTNRRRGSAVLEACLVLPVLCYITFGCIEFGDYFYLKHTMEGAAREGARAAVTGTANSDVLTAVANCMNAAGLDGKYSVDITDTATPPNPITISATNPIAGTAIVVKVKSTWGTVGIHVNPLPYGGLPSSKIIYGSTTMRREG